MRIDIVPHLDVKVNCGVVFDSMIRKELKLEGMAHEEQSVTHGSFEKIPAWKSLGVPDSRQVTD